MSAKSHCSYGKAGGSETIEFKNTLVADVKMSNLHLASRRGHIEEIKTILASISDKETMQSVLLQATPNIGWTPLHFACYAGSFEAVQLLVEAMKQYQLLEVGINTLSTDQQSTPLMEAIVKRDAAEKYSALQVGGNPIIVEYLLQEGADPCKADFEGKRPIEAALSTNVPELITSLAKYGADLSVLTAESGNTLLHQAVSIGADVIVSCLLKLGAGVNALNKSGETPLNLSKSYQNGDKIIPMLLQHGANVNHPNQYGQNVIQEAAEYYNLENVKLFLQYGADVHFANPHDGQTLLHIACQNRLGSCNFDVVKELVDNGVDVFVADKNGQTPLHLAANAHYNNEKVIRYLLEQGSDINAKDKKGMAPINCTSEFSCWKVLEESGAKNAAESLIIPDIYNNYSRDRHTIFQHLCANRRLIDIKYLLEKYKPDIHHAYDDSIEPKDRVGQTALHSACRTVDVSNLAVVKLLVGQGANVNLKDGKGQTPLHLVANGSSPKCQVFEYLVNQGGGDINVQDNDGKTPLWYASQHSESRLSAEDSGTGLRWTRND